MTGRITKNEIAIRPGAGLIGRDGQRNINVQRAIGGRGAQIGRVILENGGSSGRRGPEDVQRRPPQAAAARSGNARHLPAAWPA